MHQAERATFTAIALFAAVIVTVNGESRVSRTKQPPRLPRASTASLSIGDFVTIGGVTYQLTLSPSLVPVTVTPPPPPPPGPGVVVVKNRTTGQIVTTARPGDLLELEGANLGGPGGRVQLAGRIAANPTVWTATAIQFAAPDPGSSAITGGWDVYQPAGITFTVVAASGSFTLLPAGNPPPPPPPGAVPLMVTGFRDSMGNLAQQFAPGSTVFIQGQGFGTVKGTVRVGVNLVPVLFWTPTEIQLICPALPTGSQTGPVLLEVRSADGRNWDQLRAFSIVAPGAGKVRF